MSKLNILGAQRIKALTEMLNHIEDKAIKELRATFKQEQEISYIADVAFGIEELRQEAKGLESRLRDTLKEINETTGEGSYFSIYKSTQRSTDWHKFYKDLKQEQQKDVDMLKEAFSDKRRQLWLCETLEEAKKVVGLEE